MSAAGTQFVARVERSEMRDRNPGLRKRNPGYGLCKKPLVRHDIS
jgi:hypothetical protein